MELQDNYEELAQAIVVQAVDDWKEARRRLRGRRVDREARDMLEEVEDFFKSDWFTTLTGTDGKAILKRMQEEL